MFRRLHLRLLLAPQLTEQFHVHVVRAEPHALAYVARAQHSDPIATEGMRQTPPALTYAFGISKSLGPVLMRVSALRPLQ
jgi:hypothetical protein